MTLHPLGDRDFRNFRHRDCRLRDFRVTGEGRTPLSVFTAGVDNRPSDKGYHVLAPVRVPLMWSPPLDVVGGHYASDPYAARLSPDTRAKHDV